MPITFEELTPDDDEFGKPLSGAERTRAHRERLREMGANRTDRFRPDGIGGFKRIHQSQFIAWDGEGSGVDYTLLGYSDGEHAEFIRNDKGLTTREILEFVAEVDARYPKPIHVIFSGGYDFNHWLRSLDRVELKAVHRGKKHSGRKYETIELAEDYPVLLQVLMGKWFDFKLSGMKKHIKVYDVWGFFQSSFVKACDAFITGKFGEERWLEAEMIEYMKLHRSELENFSDEDVWRYNRAELVNLVRLMDTLRDQASSVGLVPQTWHGPSVIAAKMLKDNDTQRRHMSQYVSDDDRSSSIPAAVRRAARFAYAGGRAEMLKFGDIAGPVYSYDINSAYPAAMRELPSLQGGEWVHHTGNPQLKRGRSHFAVYRVRWEMRGEHIEYPGPLPYRRHNGTMVWPVRGESWVWWPEFQAAWDSQFAGMTVLEAWVYTPRQNSPKPFKFVQERYTERLVLKARKDGGQVAIKLGLNSMYGRLAQQAGARLVREKNTKLLAWQIPPHHQIEWAGWVTSWCRAEVFKAAAKNPWAIVAFATDALFSLEPLDLALGDQLGAWELTVWDEFCNIQSGFYFGVVEGKPVRKSRGVDKNLDVEGLVRAHWEEREVPMSREGFYSLGLALSQDFSKWRTWPTVKKTVRIGATTKRKFLDNVDDRGMFRSFVVPEFPCGHEACDGGGTLDYPVSHPHKVLWIPDTRTNGMEMLTLMRENQGAEGFSELDADLLSEEISGD